MHQLQFIVTYISSSYSRYYGHFYRWHQSGHLSKLHIMIYDIDFDKYPYSPFYSIRRKGRYKSSPSCVHHMTSYAPFSTYPGLLAAQSQANLKHLSIVLPLRIHLFQALDVTDRNRYEGDGLSPATMCLVYAVCHVICMSSACANPVIYGFLNENFSKEFKAIYAEVQGVVRRCSRRQSRSSVVVVVAGNHQHVPDNELCAISPLVVKQPTQTVERD